MQLYAFCSKYAKKKNCSIKSRISQIVDIIDNQPIWNKVKNMQMHKNTSPKLIINN